MKSANIFIDGACRYPGKPECFSIGACVTIDADDTIELEVVHEYESTSQRGEIIALLQALSKCMQLIGEGYELFYIVSDSEYVVNSINKGWYRNWENKGWVTAENEPVKNKDLWEKVLAVMNELVDYEVVVYHIKGHVIPMGKVTTKNLIKEDGTFHKLLSAVEDKYEAEKHKRKDAIDYAYTLFERVNETPVPSEEVMKTFIVGNVIVDTVAGIFADEIKNNGL